MFSWGSFCFLFKLSREPPLRRASNIFHSHNKEIQGLLFLPLEKILKTKNQEQKFRNGTPRTEGSAYISMQASLSCLLFLAHFKHQIYVH